MYFIKGTKGTKGNENKQKGRVEIGISHTVRVNCLGSKFPLAILKGLLYHEWSIKQFQRLHNI
jgi:hypothetical protein